MHCRAAVQFAFTSTKHEQRPIQFTAYHKSALPHKVKLPTISLDRLVTAPTLGCAYV
jgi:hypothetical protein